MSEEIKKLLYGNNEIKKLIDGNKIFRKKYFDKDNTLFQSLVHHGQRPKTLIIACSDSRVDPAMIFNCQPGELFVIRNVANLVPTCENNESYHGISAALEFGVKFLEVKNIIILGHTQCGGIQALIANSNNIFEKKKYSFISKWMEIARPALEKVKQLDEKITFENKVILCEQYALINSLNNLLTFPWINERINKKKLTLHAWYFNLENGFIYMYDSKNDKWRY